MTRNDARDHQLRFWMSCLICAITATILGLHADAVAHVQHAVRIIADTDGASRPDAQPTLDLISYFEFLNMLYVHYDPNFAKDTTLQRRCGPWGHLEPFDDIESAERQILSLSKQTLEFVWLWQNAAFEDEDEVACVRGMLHVSVESTQKRLPHIRAADERVGVLNALLDLCDLFLARTGPGPQPQQQEIFQRVLRLVQQNDHHAETGNPRGPLVSLGTWRIWLYLCYGLDGRNGESSQHAVSLLQDAPQFEGLWDSRVARKTLDVVSEYETQHETAVSEVYTQQVDMTVTRIVLQHAAGSTATYI